MSAIHATTSASSSREDRAILSNSCPSGDVSSCACRAMLPSFTSRTGFGFIGLAIAALTIVPSRVVPVVMLADAHQVVFAVELIVQQVAEIVAGQPCPRGVMRHGAIGAKSSHVVRLFPSERHIPLHFGEEAVPVSW